MLAQGLHRLGVAPEQPDWYRVRGEWVWGTSASVMQAEAAADEAIAAFRERMNELQAELRERNMEKMREAMKNIRPPSS